MSYARFCSWANDLGRSLQAGVPASLRKVISGDLQQKTIGIREVDGVGDLVVAELERDALRFEFGLGGFEVGMRGGTQGQMPGLAVCGRRLILLSREQGEECRAQTDEDGHSTAVAGIHVFKTQRADIPVLRRFWRGAAQGEMIDLLQIHGSKMVWQVDQST